MPSRAPSCAPPGPFRVALMLPRLSRYGGVERFGWQLAEALCRRGHSVDFLCARREGPLPQGAHVVELGRPPGFKALKMLWFALRAEERRRKGGYDVCVSLGKTWNQDIFRVGGGPLRGFWRLSREAWEPGLPRLLKQISRRLQPANWLTLFLERRIYGKTPHIVGISDMVSGWVLEEYPHLSSGANGQSLHTIYNCPDLTGFRAPDGQERERARAALGVREGEFAIGIATANFALKGVTSLIRALALLERGAGLHVAGGRGSGRYERLAASLGLADRVRFHGRQADMRRFYHALDMFVLPTFYDTLGNVVLEAMSCGLKTLCSGRAGASAFLPAELIIQNPADPEEVAAKIRTLRAREKAVPFVSRGAGVEDFVRLVERVAREKEGLR